MPLYRKLNGEVRAATTHGQRVAMLVDEYDKPILDSIENPEIARQLREVLKDPIWTPWLCKKLPSYCNGFKR